MQQFTVPQFIEVEDKIIGPITVRQFIIMVVGGLFMFLEYKLSDFMLFIVLALPTFAIFGTFAFLKVNGMPFHYFCLNFVATMKRPKIRTWSRQPWYPAKGDLEKKSDSLASAVSARPYLTGSRITDLALVVDTGGTYRGEEAEMERVSFHS